MIFRQLTSCHAYMLYLILFIVHETSHHITVLSVHQNRTADMYVCRSKKPFCIVSEVIRHQIKTKQTHENISGCRFPNSCLVSAHVSEHLCKLICDIFFSMWLFRNRYYYIITKLTINIKTRRRTRHSSGETSPVRCCLVSLETHLVSSPISRDIVIILSPLD